MIRTYDLRHSQVDRTRTMWDYLVWEGLEKVRPDQPFTALLAGVLVNGTRRNVRLTFSLEPDEVQGR